MAFEIEKGIAKPKNKSASKYPWDEMEVGDSFFIHGKVQTAVSSAVSQAGRRRGKKFSTAAIKDADGKTIGVRVWRDK